MKCEYICPIHRVNLNYTWENGQFWLVCPKGDFKVRPTKLGV